MLLRIDGLLVLLAASAALAGLPGDGWGQGSAGEAEGTDAERSPGHRLEARARKLADRGREGWSLAARLYARAAERRGPAHTGAAEDLVLAGHLQYYAGDHPASVRAFRTAGRLLLASGRLDAAVVAFRDGAWVADRAGLSLDAQELCRWIEALTHDRPQGPRADRQRRFTSGAARRS